MTERWPLIELIEVCETVVDCVNKTAPLAEEATPYKMLRTTNVRDGYVDTANCRFVSRDVYEKWTRRQVPRRGDVILTREAPLGEVGMLRDNETVFLGQRLMSYRADPSKLDANFLLYSLMGPELQAQIRATGSGATVEHMRVPDAERLKIRLPDLSTQQRIGTILASYDALILNNQRRIAILEDMARRLFDEWFVRFRFPGHEAVPLVKTELGMIPEGWQIETARQSLTYTGGGTPSKAEPSYWDDGDIQWFTPTDLTKSGLTFLRRSSLMITKEGLAKSSARLFPSFSIMMTSRATLGVFAINTEPATTNQGFITFIPSSRTPVYFLFHMLKREFPRMEAVASGATFKEITKGALGELVFTFPPEHLVQRFEQVVTPMMEQIAIISRQNDGLRAARDLLLPKLISGEINVSVAEDTFAEAAE